MAPGELGRGLARVAKWPRAPLGRLLRLEYGKGLTASQRDASGPFPVAGSNGPNGTHSDALVTGPGIVVGRKGSAGKVYWYDTDFWPIDTTYYVVPKLPLDMRWAYYLLRQLRLEQLATTTGVPGLNRNDAYRLEVPYPLLSEQRRIVAILDHADRLRRLRAAADAKADRILPALFGKMFGDPATNPKGFDALPLGDRRLGVLDRGRSRHRPRNDPSLLGGPHPLIQTGDVARCDGRIRNYSQTYSDLGLSQSKMWPAGTLCITIAANIANTGVLEFDACFPDSVVGFVPGAKATTEYVQFFLWFLQPLLERTAPHAAQKNINLEILRDLPCPLPPRELQDKFSMRVREHYAARRHQIESRERLESLFANMGLRGFTGALTASWREDHMDDLLQEMEHQAKALAETH